MNVLNSKSAPAKTKANVTPTALDFQWAGTVARIRRGGGSPRAGRRSALLGLLTSVYANSSRGARPADPKPKDGTAGDRS